jgi:hypothetical protein
MLTLATVSFSSQMLYAQQEVDPDHFDQKPAQVQKAAPAHHVKHSHAMVASKHVNPKHHRSA